MFCLSTALANNLQENCSIALNEINEFLRRDKELGTNLVVQINGAIYDLVSLLA